MIHSMNLEIDTEPISTLQDRRRGPPLRMLMLCAGIGGGLITLKELGYNIELVHAVECDKTLQKILKSLHPEVEVISDDVKHLSQDHVTINNYNYLDFGPPCQPWSRCPSPAPIGFEDTRAEVFTWCGIIKRWVLQQNPRAITIGETVVLHKNLGGDKHLHNLIMQGTAFTHEATTAGSLTRRLRQWWTTPPVVPKPDPPRSLDLFLPPGASMPPGREHFPCIVSSTDSHDDPSYIENDLTIKACPNELDVLQGYAPGVSEGGRAPFNTPITLTTEYRKKLIGQAFNRYQYGAIVKALPSRMTHITHKEIWSVHPKELTLEAFETGMMDKTLEQKVEYFQRQLDTHHYDEVVCWLEPLHKESAPYVSSQRRIQ